MADDTRTDSSDGAGRGWYRSRAVGVKAISLLLLRVSTGMLAVWWGLARLTNPGLGQMLTENFYGRTLSVTGGAQEQLTPLFSGPVATQVFGGFQVALGALVILGLFRFVALPLQILINLFTAISVWWAIIDPFKLYLEPYPSNFQFTQLFYPSAIILAASLVSYAFRDQDRLSLSR